MVARTPRAIGIQLMAVWLVIWGINFFVSISGLTALLALLAIIAGLLILAGR
jgi:hypothetical protein